MAIGPYFIDVLLIVKSITLTVMLVGLLVLPLLPGLVIIWVAALGYGLAAGFGTLGWIMFAILTVLMLAGTVVDNVLMGRSAHKEGAPWWVHPDCDCWQPSWALSSSLSRSSAGSWRRW